MNPSVLVCDDSNLARKQVMRSLPEAWKVDLQQATNGREALELLRKTNIDVMFLDLTMPDIDGLGVLEGIKALGLSLNVFVISADIQPEMQSRVMDLGARAFLRKPISPDVLTSVLEQHGLV